MFDGVLQANCPVFISDSAVQCICSMPAGIWIGAKVLLLGFLYEREDRQGMFKMLLLQSGCVNCQTVSGGW